MVYARVMKNWSQASAAGWSLWLVATLTLKFTQPESQLGPLITLFNHLIDVGILAAGITFSLLLARRFERPLAVFLALISAYAFWRFQIGGILFKMQPELGGLTFNEAMDYTWKQSSQTWLVFIATVPFVLFVMISIVAWSISAMMLPMDKPAKQ
ncbi:MAG: hypothetical protein EBS05_14020 [Proteobacteria bacterium]|jgi:glucan phosphoethanolaminetransferase (alkaline phosphatase superfamily)|nr:hypothetical protein [Pseudomonadota bacterium]